MHGVPHFVSPIPVLPLKVRPSDVLCRDSECPPLLAYMFMTAVSSVSSLWLHFALYTSRLSTRDFFEAKVIVFLFFLAT